MKVNSVYKTVSKRSTPTRSTFNVFVFMPEVFGLNLSETQTLIAFMDGFGSINGLQQSCSTVKFVKPPLGSQ